uniref:Uncharacterized protein n=1 Tax=Ditylenchus dipsaci TaxID=166011 RepID=A0A915EMR2_9BILA
MNGMWEANHDSENPAPSHSPSTEFRRRRRSGPLNQLAQRVLHRRRRLPVCVHLFQWLPRYNWRECFFSDLSAGLTMAVFSVPLV